MRIRQTPEPTAELTSHVTQILGESGKSWLSDLPGMMSELEQRWDMEIGEPFPAGEFNFVAAATRGGDEPVVIKIAPPYTDNEAYTEAAYLRNRAGDACVRLLAADRPLRSMLLERALPGENVAERFAGRAMDMVQPGIEVLRAIVAPEPTDQADVLSLDRWFEGLETAMESDFPRAYSQQALESYALLRTERPAGYLHGDFHPGNIVAATRSPFMVIDPKGLIGHIGYDISVYLNNLLYIHPVKADLHAAASRFARAFGLSETDVRRWAFAGYVLGKWWSYKDMPQSYADELALANIWDD
jgi:streptomycin 6-kinase